MKPGWPALERAFDLISAHIATCPSPLVPLRGNETVVSTAARVQGLGGVLSAKHASLRRAGVHGWIPWACAKQDSAAQCTPPRNAARAEQKPRFLLGDTTLVTGSPMGRFLLASSVDASHPPLRYDSAPASRLRTWSRSPAAASSSRSRTSSNPCGPP